MGDGGAEESPRHADNDADVLIPCIPPFTNRWKDEPADAPAAVLDGARHRSNDSQQRDNQRHARRVGGEAAEGAPVLRS